MLALGIDQQKRDLVIELCPLPVIVITVAAVLDVPQAVAMMGASRSHNVVCELPLVGTTYCTGCMLLVKQAVAATDVAATTIPRAKYFQRRVRLVPESV